MHVEQRVVGGPVLARDHLVDDDGDRVRQLVAHALERGLADELGDHDELGLVGELAVGVERRALGQQPDEQVGEQLHLVAATPPTPARPRPTRCRASRRAARPRAAAGRRPSCGDEVGLGDDRDLRRAPRRARARCAMNRSPGPIGLVGRQAEADDVDLGPRLAHERVEPLAEQRARLVQAGRVDEHELGVGRGARCRGSVCRVVCGLLEVIATFSPTSALVSVDLPALGRPTKQAKPERCSVTSAVVPRESQ